MLLCVDIGNTNVVFGIEVDKLIIDSSRCKSSLLGVEEFFECNKEFLNKYNFDKVVISSVVPRLNDIFNELFIKYYNINPYFITTSSNSIITINIPEPSTLGTDLLCDSSGATVKYGSPNLVIDLGTALKFLIVNNKNEYIGGAFYPGLKTSLKALVSSAALLSETEVIIPENVICNTTSSCIQSGITYGGASLIDGMIRKIKKELKVEHLKVILTGGLSPVIKDLLEEPFIYDEYLLFSGMIDIYYRNIKKD